MSYFHEYILLSEFSRRVSLVQQKDKEMFYDLVVIHEEEDGGGEECVHVAEVSSRLSADELRQMAFSLLRVSLYVTDNVEHDQVLKEFLREARQELQY